MIGGDTAGLPNGRRLFDDTVDIFLRVAGGFLVPANQGGKQLPLGDGVDKNDKPFLSGFPLRRGTRLRVRLADQAEPAVARSHTGRAAAGAVAAEGEGPGPVAGPLGLIRSDQWH